MTPALSPVSPPSAPTAQVKPHGPFLTTPPGDLYPNLNTRACFLSHRLTDHPLFEMPRLLELAKFLPKKLVRINSGAVPAYATPAQIPATGQTPEQAFEQMENSTTRIMLKSIELEPEYRELLQTCLAEMEALGHPCMRNPRKLEGYVFISAPSMTTPYHMDPEINFLFQVRGTKTFHVLSGDDRDILTEEDIEQFYSGKHDHLNFKEETLARAIPFEMHPGSGVHIPVNHPHWVTTTNEVTISFALTLQTAATDRRGAIYAMNHYLRKRGGHPVPFGKSPVRDFFKFQGFRLCRGLSYLIPGRKRQEAAH